MDWIREPFLQVRANGLYNPITDRTMRADDEGFQVLSSWAGKVHQDSLWDLPSAEGLIREGWLVRDDPRLFCRFRLEYVSLETHSTCNQKCSFCPVSVAPRAREVMSMELFERIVTDVAGYRETVKGLFLFSYNEPTTDPLFLERLEHLAGIGMKVAVNTNATGLTPSVCRRIEQLGGIEHLSINLSTLDRQKYLDDRGADHLALVLRNLDDLKDRPVAKRMVITVLGGGDRAHKAEAEAIRRRFRRSRFEVSEATIMDRAGLLGQGAKPPEPQAHLAGCENMGSRPIQHLHVTPNGTCVLCCQDYFQGQVLGNLERQTIREVLGGEAAAKLRRWIYGQTEAPAEFMCRHCTFAVKKQVVGQGQWQGQGQGQG